MSESFVVTERTDLDLSLLKADPKNPRIRDPRSIREIAKSIEEFGFVQPIVTDESYNVIIGHGRVQAAKKLNLKTVPVVIAKNLSELQKKRLQIADNRLSELSAWDETLLTSTLEGIVKYEPLDIPGFDLPEIDDLLGFTDINLAKIEESPFQEKTIHCTEYHLLVSCKSEHKDKIVFLCDHLKQQLWCELEMASR